MKYKPVEVYLSHPDFALDDLADELTKGRIALILGSGISSNLGLPTWWELVKNCVNIAKIDADIDSNTSNKQLRSIMERVKDHYTEISTFHGVVRSALYPHSNPAQSRIIKQDLLIALGAMCMGSYRGSVDTIITLNYDDILEWYLMIHGVVSDVVTELPILHGSTDIRIYHAHGFLPKYTNYQDSKKIILSQYDYDESLSDSNNPMHVLFRHILKTKVCLFVGLSGDDPIFGPLLVNVKADIVGRYTGFWLFKKNEKIEEKVQWAQKRNVVPLIFDNYDEMPSFLLKVCQTAAKSFKAIT